MIEFKRSSVEVADCVRQLITNQEEIFNKDFFSTVQLVFAGSDSQGLRYGTAGTPEQLFVEWKEQRDSERREPPMEFEEAPQAGFELDAKPLSPGGSSVEVLPATLRPGALLDSPLAQICDKRRLLDLIRNFIIFDAGQKKVPRHHQFLGLKAAQDRIRKRRWSGGSGRSTACPACLRCCTDTPRRSSSTAIFLPAPRRTPTNRTIGQRSRSESTRPCARRLRRAGRVIPPGKHRCSMRSSRS